jgi:hypothetical protein
MCPQGFGREANHQIWRVNSVASTIENWLIYECYKWSPFWILWHDLSNGVEGVCYRDVDWIQKDQDTVQRQDLLNIVMNLPVP